MAINKFLKNSSLKQASMIEDSKVFKERDLAPTDIYALNIAYSGSLFGGVDTGLTLWAGPSRHFKSVYTLLSVKAWMDKYPESVCLFYDSEFGTPSAYFKSVGIDTSRVIHLPVTNIEELKSDVVKQITLAEIEDRVIIAIDSIGNSSSFKEINDALDEKVVSDMTRAKALKSFTRMITPILKTKDIPCIGVNHTYQEIGMFPKTIMGGGCVIEGTEVLMADGTIKEIQDIQVGEYVKTAVGDHEVTHIWNPTTLEIGEPECYEIEFEDGTTYTISDNDHLFVDGKLVKVKDLQVGDLVDKIK